MRPSYLAVRHALFLFFLIFLTAFAMVAHAADWPMWRYDAGRTAASSEQLPNELHLQWVREYSPRQQVWDDPLNNDLMPYDKVFEPVVLGDTMFVGFNDSDKVVALDAATGEERWRFYTDGPVRLPAVCDQGKVLFASDDGYLYCLDAASGAVRWKFRGGPSERKVLGNRRLISSWPARGGPVVADGVVYFAASIWPFMGTFIYALDAETGSVVWRNDRMSAQWINQPHQNPSFAGVAPQGAFVVSDGHLLVPGGRSVPCCFDLKTGAYQYYFLADYGKSGGSFVCAGGGVFFNHYREQIATMYDLEGGREIAARVGRYPVIADGMFYTSGDAIVACDIQKVRNTPQAWREQALWQVAVDASGDLIKAGSRLYAAGKGHITSFDVPDPNAQPQQAWSTPVEGDVGRLLAANGRLFAVTMDGRIMAFGAEKREPAALKQTPPAPADNAGARERAKAILDGCGVRDGFALVHGLGDGALLEALASGSNLTLIAFDEDNAKVGAMRQRLDAAGLYGARVVVHQGTAVAVPLPPYMAALTIVGDVKGAGLEANEACVRALFKSMRPYDGKLWIPLTGDVQGRFVSIVEKLALPGAVIAKNATGVILTREGPLPGSASWTHQYGDVANSVKSDDATVKMPLGLLWFGGNSNLDVLPRHGHGPPEQVIGGRLFIEGMDCISARDVYTGRVLWKTQLGDLGTFNVYFDKTYQDAPTNTAYNQTHIPGANARGTNFVATLDRVYILQGPQCHVLDATTGERVATFTSPAQGGESPDWGYIGVYEDTLVLGCGRVPFSALPSQGEMNPKEQETYNDFWRYDVTASRDLIAMDRHTGEVRWTATARHGFLHNGIAIGNGTVFCLDRRPPQVEEFFKRRGVGVAETYRLLALDIANGGAKWEQQQNVFGSWLGYSKEHDVLVQATRPSSDMVKGEDGRRMIVHKASDGSVVWDKELAYRNPPMLHGDRIITDTAMYMLLTGEPAERVNPLTGNPMPWVYERTKGCNYQIAAENILTFRSSAAGYYDLTSDGGTGHFGGFKSGCTSNLIAADGVLNAPDYTRTCSCSYQNQTSLAFVYDPDVEMWTTFPEFAVDAPIQRLGVNLGAPGDHRDENGTLWLEYPAVGGDSPKVGIHIGGDVPGAIPRGSVWKYLDNGTDQGTAWREAGFDDGAWASGPAELGYGDGDEATVVGFGPDAKKKFVTTYFRHAFEVAEPPPSGTLQLNVKHDDGVIVYLNGKEVFRAAMPAGDVNYLTPASDADAWDSTTIDAALLTKGANVLAAEVHQGGPGSSDVSFDLEMAPPVDGPEWILHHTSFMEGDGPKWVGASAAVGLEEMRVDLVPAGAPPRAYTVRLYFAEVQDTKVGERVFGVGLQGNLVLADFDIAKEAGGPRRTIVKEFPNVPVADSLRVTLTPSPACAVKKPLLSGIEVVAEAEQAQPTK